jgi:hypothetical protein
VNGIGTCIGWVREWEGRDNGKEGEWEGKVSANGLVGKGKGEEKEDEERIPLPLRSVDLSPPLLQGLARPAALVLVCT